MLKKVLVLAAVIVVVGVLLVLLWPTPTSHSQPSEESANGVPVSIEVELPSELDPEKQNTGFFSQLRQWLGVRKAPLPKPAVGSKFASVTSTAYASSPYQTDSTPCITAAGTTVRPGTVAANFLPLGTILRISVDGRELDYDFIVEDRMNARYYKRIDIWFPQTSDALVYGKRNIEIRVVGYGQPGQAINEPEPTPSPKKTADATLVEGEEGSDATLLQRIALQMQTVRELLFTAVGRDPNRYDVDCVPGDDNAIDFINER